MAISACLIFDTCPALSMVGAARRHAIGTGPRERTEHDRLVDEIAALNRTELSEPPAPAAPPDGSARVAFWNVERGRYLDEAAALLAVVDADVSLLCELDHGMARSFQRHTARDLAARTGQGYAFAVEFLELDLGAEHERAWHDGEENDAGLHGAAILSPHALGRPALIRLETDGDWFDGARGERRVGGRIALAATVAVAGVDVTCVSVHLESHSDPRHRARQMAVLLDAVDAYAPGAPTVIGGDFNTQSAARDRVDDRAGRVALLAEDPRRYVDPVRHEPLFDAARAAGFNWAACNAPGPTQRTPRYAAPRPHPGRLDWFFTRGVDTTDPVTVAAVDGDGRAISDHDLLAVTIRPAV